jgi:hypothetical protein
MDYYYWKTSNSSFSGQETKLFSEKLCVCVCVCVISNWSFYSVVPSFSPLFVAARSTLSDKSCSYLYFWWLMRRFRDRCCKCKINVSRNFLLDSMHPIAPGQSNSHCLVEFDTKRLEACIQITYPAVIQSESCLLTDKFISHYYCLLVTYMF